jgi:mRNA interferase MazF
MIATVRLNNELNHNDYPTTIIIPLSTSLVDDAKPIRYRITKKDDLKEDSDLVITQIRAIDNDRFIKKTHNIIYKRDDNYKKTF